MDNTPKPPRDPVKNTRDLHVSVLDKAAEIARTRADEENRRREMVRRQNAEYFEGKK